MTKWQPIETAPRDGTEILCFIPEHTWGLLTVKEEYKVLRFIQGVTWANQGLYTEYPTHWMPLPKPPETEE